MQITLYRGAKREKPEGVKDHASWVEVKETIELLVQQEPTAPAHARPARQKETLAAFGPYRLKPGTKRANENVEAITLAVLDLDRMTVPILEALESYPDAFAWYESPSSTEAALRLRVIAPVSREVLPEECERVRFAFAERLNAAPGCGVEASKDPARIFFGGKLHGTPDRDWGWQDGAPLDVDALLAAPLAHSWGAPKHKPAPGSTGDGADSIQLAKARVVAEHCEPAIEGMGGDAALYRCARELGSVLGEDVAAIERVLVETYNPRCIPPWDGAKLRYEAERAAKEQSNPIARAMRDRPAKAAKAANADDQFRFAATGEGADDLTLDYDAKGRPVPTTCNVSEVLRYMLGNKLRYDDMAGKVRIAGVAREMAYLPDGPWTDAHTTEAVKMCERFGVRAGKGVVADAVILHAKQRTYNPLADWLRSSAEKWDGTPRVDTAMARYWGAANTPAHRAASRVFLLSLAARGLTPGCKVDTALLLQGEQGAKKSSALKALAGTDDWFSDSPLAIGSKDALETIRGKWIWEIAENASISSREKESVKAFLSASSDCFRASYARFSEDVKRTCVFAISTNDYQILDDPTGARRYLPVVVGTIDLDAIASDREQLMAEAARRILDGEQHWPTEEEKAALKPAHESATIIDQWEDLISDWAEAREHKPFTLAALHDEITGGVPMPVERRDRKVQARVAACLRRLGYERTMVKTDTGGRARGWARKAE